MTETIEEAAYKELVLSYTQAGRVVPTTLNIVSGSLCKALKFESSEEVHEVFQRARDMADIPTQMVLKKAMLNHRAEKVPSSQAITWESGVNEEQKKYIYAWWHLHGTRMGWMTDSQAEEIIDRFESDPKNKEFKEWQNRNWTHVAADIVARYGVATLRTRL